LQPPQLIVNSPTPTASRSASISNGPAPIILLDADGRISTLVVHAGEDERQRLVREASTSAGELQHSVSDTTESLTISNTPPRQTSDGNPPYTSNAGSLMNHLSLLDVTKLCVLVHPGPFSFFTFFL